MKHANANTAAATAAQIVFDRLIDQAVESRLAEALALLSPVNTESTGVNIYTGHEITGRLGGDWLHLFPEINRIADGRGPFAICRSIRGRGSALRTAIVEAVREFVIEHQAGQVKAFMQAEPAEAIEAAGLDLEALAAAAASDAQAATETETPADLETVAAETTGHAGADALLAAALTESDRMTTDVSDTVGLIACSGSKLDHAAPARELCTGRLFRGSVELGRSFGRARAGPIRTRSSSRTTGRWLIMTPSSAQGRPRLIATASDGHDKHWQNRENER